MSEETAFALDDDEALAFAVAFAEIESGGKAEYDFDEGEWRN